MKIQPKYIQIVGDAVIPLFGLLLWDWSLYFILLFYFIDYLSGEVIAHLKSKKIASYQGTSIAKSDWLKWSLKSNGLLILAMVVVHLGLTLVNPSIHFVDEFISFLTYEELGIQQGYILIPLVVFSSLQQYRFYFVMPARERTTPISAVWKRTIQATMIVIAGAGLASGVALLVTLPEWVYVVGIVIVSSAYKLKYT